MDQTSMRALAEAVLRDIGPAFSEATQYALDDLVHTEAERLAAKDVRGMTMSFDEILDRRADEAAGINNEGPVSQVAFLLEHGFRVEDIHQALATAEPELVP